MQKLARYYLDGEKNPFYVRWVMWCWHKPIFIGLPLTLLAIPLMVGEALLAIMVVLSYWGRKQGD